MSDIEQHTFWIWEWDFHNVCHFGTVDIPVTTPLVPHHRRMEGDHHFQMKASAELWLRSLGYADASPERRYPGGRADIWTEAGLIAVECGNVGAQKVIDAVNAGIAVVVMFYKGLETWWSGGVFSPDWREGETPTFLVAFPAERRDELVERLGIKPVDLHLTTDVERQRTTDALSHRLTDHLSLRRWRSPQRVTA